MSLQRSLQVTHSSNTFLTPTPAQEVSDVNMLSLFVCLLLGARALERDLEEQLCLLLVRISLFAECINFQHFPSVVHPDNLLVS